MHLDQLCLHQRVELSENAYVSAFDFKTDVLRNVSFVAEGLGENVTAASAIFLVSAAETYAELFGRGASISGRN